MSIEEVAKKIKVKPEKIVAWEGGELSPTVRQGRDLAKNYDRHFLEFFAKSIPELPKVELVPDFRFYHSEISREERRALEIIQEKAEGIRTNAIDLLNDLDEEPHAFSDNLRFTYDDDPSISAQTVREAMDFPIQTQLGIKKNEKYKFPNILRDLIEKMGVIALKFNALNAQNARGMCLNNKILPIIILGSEAPSAQAFTLMHEFAHVVIGNSAISSGLEREQSINDQNNKIEGWCNKFAAAFLMPEKDMRQIDEIPTKKVDSISEVWLQDKADSFGVSRHAFLIRLMDLELVNPDFYWKKMRPKFLEEARKYKPYGRSPYYAKRYVNTYGKFYTSLVLEALNRNVIDAHNASNFLGIKKLEYLEYLNREVRI